MRRTSLTMLVMMNSHGEDMIEMNFNSFQYICLLN